eukprot:13926266-Heterocapsa_arctica.AAC.1
MTAALHKGHRGPWNAADSISKSQMEANISGKVALPDMFGSRGCACAALALFKVSQQRLCSDK